MELSKKKLKIAQIAPIIQSVPPKKYGGTERVIYYLTEGLVRRGHSVTLFASGDSHTSATLISVYPRSLREAKIHDMYGLNDITLLHIGTAYSMQNEFDILHGHNETLGVPTANLTVKPVVITLHGPFTAMNKKIYQRLTRPHLVSISYSQKSNAPAQAHMAGVIYNGLEMKEYPFSMTNDGYLLFVGRISMEKGTHYAIQTAQMLDLPLIIAAKLDPVDRRYFQEYIEPYLSDPDASKKIQWIGEVGERERNTLMSKALCILHPVTWSEPFGLTMVEAMACGCPVVAFRKGSTSEVVKNGKTGYVVEDVEDMICAVKNINTIDRKTCREYALKKFNAEKMVEKYEELYYKILENKVSPLH